MIKCKGIEGQNGYHFETEIKGDGEKIMNEFTHIEGMIITILRKIGIPDKKIEQQLAEIICDGFEIADMAREEGKNE